VRAAYRLAAQASKGEIAMRRNPSVLLPTLILASVAQAQDAEKDQSIDKALDDIVDQVIVTGTRVADRTRLDTIAPVDVLSSATLSSSGTTELAQSMSLLAPSLNFPRPSITDGTDHVRPATLRGLAPDQTLVLVNSKRRHPSALVNVNGSIGRGSAAVDLNAIPLAAIESVEVLRDGASAQYGSDAIAGVINIRLRDARNGGEARVTYGEYDTEIGTARGERSATDGATLTASAWVGLPLGNEGFVTLTGEYRDRDPTSRGDFDPRDPRTAADIAAGVPLPVPSVTSRYGDPNVEDVTLYVNAGFPLANEWQLYGWTGYQQRDGQSAAFPRLRNNVNNVFDGQPVYADGFLPKITSDVEDLTLAFGVQGSLGEWNADFSVVYGNNQLDYGVEDSLNGTLVPGGSLNTFDAGGMEYEQLVFNAGFVRGFDWIGVAPTNFATGIEARQEVYKIQAGEEASYALLPGQTLPGSRPVAGGVAPGAQGFPGFRPANETDEDRTAVGAYADIEAQVTDKFLGSVAARVEDYSDFGSAVTGKIAGRYDFTERFALRSTVSTGFRAPGLQQAFFTSTATNFISGIPREVSTLPPSASIAELLGAKDLDPEESINYSLGGVFRNGNFEATVDAYRIDIDDRIVLSENLGGTPTIDAILAGTGVDRVRFFINGVETKTQGVDLVTRYRWRSDTLGRFDITLSANWNKTEVESLPSTNVIADGNLLFGRVNVLTFEEGQPSNKQTLAIDWYKPTNFGEWGIGIRAANYGEAIEPQAPATPVVPDVVLAPATVVDLELRAKVGQGLNFAIGADNLLDKYPSFVPPAANTTGALGFSRYSPFGFGGRFVYARLGYTWK
jgi:iron complex outermembrane receptor protein